VRMGPTLASPVATNSSVPLCRWTTHLSPASPREQIVLHGITEIMS